ncbi:MAG: DegT/DnrJ/EryC1/StrS family aminotransferase [Candidatus Hydrogenedentes bacterium]|nr:DegT/DnrJ/EryC1/StrS family aminotransferase [Candidatus Hydrogenedentota bacterium]
MAITSASKLALHGGEPIRGNDKAWPEWPEFDEKERTAVAEVLDSGKWWYGDKVAAFERDYAAFQDAKYCITCTSGTTALELMFQALGIGPGDEVLVPPYTFVATATAVARMGGVPVFVDVDASWNMNPDLVKAAITPRTKLIVPVHFGGRACDMDRLNAIAAKHGLKVIEDACHSWGAKYKGKGTGAIGLAGAFSFQMSKNITAGEGGAIVTDDEEFADRCRSFSNCGRMKGGVWYEHYLTGTNARLTEIQGAILSAQLTRLEAQTLLRERNGAVVSEGLASIEGLTPQPGDERITRRAYHLYCFRIDPDVFGCSRAKFIEAAKAEGLPLSPGYSLPLYKQPLFGQLGNGMDYGKVHCPVTEDLCGRSAVWIGHTLLLGDESDMGDIVRICEKIKQNVSALAE